MTDPHQLTISGRKFAVEIETAVKQDDASSSFNVTDNNRKDLVNRVFPDLEAGPSTRPG